MNTRLILTLLVTVGAAVAPQTSHAQAVEPTAGAETSERAEPKPKRRNPSLITAGEIQQSNASTAYDLVSRLRPSWLRKRGVASVNNEGSIKVYQDGILFGGVGSLRQINITQIGSIEFLDGMKATQRYGTGHGNGVILVATQR